MVATVPPFAAVAVCEEVPSTSCTEADVPSLEPSVKSRSLWKVAVVAITVALIAGAGTSWTRNVTEGEEVTALAGTYSYHTYGTIGCSNWATIQFSSTTVADKAACETLCASDASCTSYNWQPAACELGWEGVGPNTCIIFHGDCTTERNDCWDLVYKFAAATTVAQTLNLEANPGTARRLQDASSKAADVGAAVEAALAAETPSIAPVAIETSEVEQGAIIKVTVTWTYTCLTFEMQQAVVDFASSLLDAAGAGPFVQKVKANLPAGTTLASDTMTATQPVVSNPLPSGSTTDEVGDD